MTVGVPNRSRRLSSTSGESSTDGSRSKRALFVSTKLTIEEIKNSLIVLTDDGNENTNDDDNLVEMVEENVILC